MNRSPIPLGIAAVLAGTTAIMGVLGVVYNPILLAAALPFAGAAFVVWQHATGRLGVRRLGPADARRRARRRGDATHARGRPGPDRPGTGSRRRRRRGRPSRTRRADRDRAAAARVLDVAPDADDEAVRRAYRERVREVHPDAPDGDLAAFREVREAYERLTDDA